MDWRYWITYEGICTTSTDREEDAIREAMTDSESRLPTVEVEPLEGGEGT